MQGPALPCSLRPNGWGSLYAKVYKLVALWYTYSFVESALLSKRKPLTHDTTPSRSLPHGSIVVLLPLFSSQKVSPQRIVAGLFEHIAALSKNPKQSYKSRLQRAKSIESLHLQTQGACPIDNIHQHPPTAYHLSGLHEYEPNEMLRIIRSQKLLLSTVVVLVTFPFHVTAFSSSLPRCDYTMKATNTALASFNGNNEEEKKTRRRDVFRWIRGAALFGAGGTLTKSEAYAEDRSPGRIVELKVSNLEGNPDLTGTIKIQLEPSWAPKGVQRFEALTSIKFFDECRIFRALPGFIAQFGISGDPSLQATWRSRSIPDDPVKASNTRGTVVFATAGPGTRTTQMFINTADNVFLDKQGFSPIGRVIEGMEYVDKFYADYGEGAPAGQGPNQGKIQSQGNVYLKKNFPMLSYIESASFV